METNENGQTGAEGRLVIDRMVLTNFKSYAGEKVIGPFHKNFTSVVGPNGSGKSNVIDAMLFVFGFKTSKLRLNKVSELIHNSTHHQNLDKVSVMVHFARIRDLDDETSEKIPGTDLVVGRVAYRNNASDYYINDRKQPAKVVVERLKQEGIDLNHNRFLILQGEVEQISLMDPQALLDYLSEIIGTHAYSEPLEQLAKEVEELTELRQTAMNRAKIADKKVASTAGPAAVTQAYNAKKAELAGARDTNFQIFVRQGEQTVEKIRSNVEQVDGFLQHENDKLKEHDQALGSLKDSAKAAEDGVAETQRGLDGATRRFNDWERANAKRSEEAKAAKAKAKKLRVKRDKDAASLQKAEEDAERLPAEIEGHQAAVAELTSELEAAEAEVERLTESCRPEREALTKKLQKVNQDLQPYQREIAEAKARQSEPTAERDLLAQRQAAALQAFQDAEAGAAEAEEVATAKEAEAESMRAEQAKHLAAADEARRQETDAATRVEHCSAELRDTQGQLAQRKQAESSAASQSHIMQALSKASKTGLIAGKVHGRLGDLGTIDAQYDVAVSSCTGMLDYVVVDTTETAQQCVKYIRDKGLGVATFLILKQQQETWGQRLTQRITTPQDAPRLFDLVKPADENLKAAFYYALRDTVVARNMDRAAEIAYAPGSHLKKVVTLKGELISESGTMTGGGGKPRRGKMCLGSGPPAGAAVADGKEAAVLEQDVAKLQKALAEAQSQAAEAAKVVREATKAAAQLGTGARKAAMAAEAHRVTAADLTQRLASLEAAAQVTKEDKARLAALEAAIAVEENAIAKLQAAMAGLAADAERLNAALQGVGGAGLKKQRAVVDTLQQDIASAEEDATRKGVALAAAEKSAAKLRREVDKVTAEVEALEQKEEAAAAKHREAEQASFELHEAMKTLTEEVTQRKRVLADAIKELESADVKVRIIREKQTEFAERKREQETALNVESRKIRDNKKAMDARRKKFLDEVGPDAASPFVDMEAGELDAVDVDALQRLVLRLENELDQAAPEPGAIERHTEATAEHSARLADLEKATADRDEKRRAHEAMRKERLDRFMAGFNTISLKLKEMYQMITLGGDAELELVDNLDPFSEGIIFSVRPPKKSWKNIANLSGGEKTLSSLSLVFALHHFRPTPLYVMDEIDAALDFKNVSIVAHYIKERTRNAQFIIISLRNNMFELADRLVGIYKTDNATKSVAINPADFVVGTAPEALPTAVSIAA